MNKINEQKINYAQNSCKFAIGRSWMQNSSLNNGQCCSHTLKERNMLWDSKKQYVPIQSEIPNLNLGFIKIGKNHNWRIINSINHVL